MVLYIDMCYLLQSIGGVVMDRKYIAAPGVFWVSNSGAMSNVFFRF